MQRARAAAITVVSMLLLASCGDDEPAEQGAESVSSTTTESTSTSTTSTTTVPPLTTQEAMDHVASQPGPYGGWVPEPGTYDGTEPLSAIVGSIHLATVSSPQQLFFFAQGQPVDVDVETRSGVRIDSTEDGTVTVAISHYAPGDANCCPSRPAYLVRFHWDGDSVERLDPFPPDDQGHAG